MNSHLTGKGQQTKAIHAGESSKNKRNENTMRWLEEMASFQHEEGILILETVVGKMDPKILNARLFGPLVYLASR